MKKSFLSVSLFVMIALQAQMGLASAQQSEPDTQSDSKSIDPPSAETTPEDRLDALKPFDPEALDPKALDPNILNKGESSDREDVDPLSENLPDFLENLPGGGIETDAFPDERIAEEKVESDLKDSQADYSKLPKKAERAARLDKLFERLGAEDNADDAKLIAEEIWAIWLDSGSASIDLLIRRGTAAQKKGNITLARRMYDHVTALRPDYAEGWSRSARLAIEEEDLGRALSETTEALIREPRHFYALWTMGNLLERLGRQDAALEAYVEANRLYPELKAVKDRVTLMRGSVEGEVL